MAHYGHLALADYQPVADLLSRPSWKGRLTELSMNGERDVWVRLAGEGYVKVPPASLKADVWTMKWLKMLCGRFAASNGIRWEDDMPILACRTPDGHRLQVLVGINVESGIALSIRVKRIVNADYDSFHVKPEWREVIDQAVADGIAIILSGGTGSGKTTFLNYLCKKIDPSKRVITIEDTREVEILNPNRLHLLVSRTAGATRINYSSIIDSCLRLNPDVMLLGEVSIQNAFPLLQVWDSGHEGGLSSMHANSPRDAMRGLRRRVALGGGNVGGEISDMMDFLADNVGLVVQIKHMPAAGGETEKRVVTEVARPKELLGGGKARREAIEQEAAFEKRFDVARARDALLAANAGIPLSQREEEILRVLAVAMQASMPARAVDAAGMSAASFSRGGSLSPEDQTYVEAAQRGSLIEGETKSSLTVSEGLGVFSDVVDAGDQVGRG